MNNKPYKRPESVLVVVYTTAGEVLLLRRCRPPDFWQSVTGSLEWDEQDALVTARRELHEEIGLVEAQIINCGVTNRFPIKPEWRARYAPGVTVNTEYVFRAPLAQRIDVILNATEHEECLWLPRDAAVAKVTSYTNRDAILQFVPPMSA